MNLIAKDTMMATVSLPDLLHQQVSLDSKVDVLYPRGQTSWQDPEESVKTDN